MNYITIYITIISGGILALINYFITIKFNFNHYDIIIIFLIILVLIVITLIYLIYDSYIDKCSKTNKDKLDNDISNLENNIKWKK